MAVARIVEKKFMEYGNDTQKIYSQINKSRFTHCRRRFMVGQKDFAAKVCTGYSS